MKKLILLCMSCIMGISYAQEQKDIDQRLVEYHGDKITKVYNDNQDYYKFLLYELDNSFFITEISDVNTNQKNNYKNISEVKDKNGVVFDISLLNNKSSFNFFNYSFLRSQNERIFYELGDGRFLVFYSLNEIKINYGK